MAEDKQCMQNFSETAYLADVERIFKVFFRKRDIWFFKIVWPCIATNSLRIKPADALSSSFIGITILHVSGSLSAHHQEYLAVRWNWYILCSFDDRLLPGAGYNCNSILLLVASGHRN